MHDCHVSRGWFDVLVNARLTFFNGIYDSGPMDTILERASRLSYMIQIQILNTTLRSPGGQRSFKLRNDDILELQQIASPKDGVLRMGLH